MLYSSVYNLFAFIGRKAPFTHSLKPCRDEIVSAWAVKLRSTLEAKPQLNLIDEEAEETQNQERSRTRMTMTTSIQDITSVHYGPEVVEL